MHKTTATAKQTDRQTEQQMHRQLDEKARQQSHVDC